MECIRMRCALMFAMAWEQCFSAILRARVGRNFLQNVLRLSYVPHAGIGPDSALCSPRPQLFWKQ